MHDPDVRQPDIDSIVLGIRSTVGTLVVHVGDALVGAEIEISPGTDPTVRRIRNVVHVRHVLGGRMQHSAVFPDVPEGIYTVWTDKWTPDGTATVYGGQVSDYHLTGSPSS